MSQITLQPVTMRITTEEDIYAPSRIRQTKVISETEFLFNYADQPRPIRVSLEPDGVSKPVIVTAYGFGLDCWYIVTGVAGEVADNGSNR
jgi:hypothetical protein